MRKLFYLPIPFVFFIIACNSGGLNGNKLKLTSAQIENAPGDEIDEVRLVIDDEYVAATAPWNNGFELEFPKTIPVEHLDDIDYTFLIPEEAYPRFQISDRNVKVGEAELNGYKRGEYVGDDFCYLKYTPSGYVDVLYYYSDGPVTIKGECERLEMSGRSTSYKYDIKLKMGWNQVALIKEVKGREEYEVTTTLPDGLQWSFE